MMRVVAMLAALAVLAATPTFAGAQATALRLSELADGMCVDVLSGRVSLPASHSGDDAFYAGYGLISGVSGSAMDAFGRDISLIAQARLASGTTDEGPFVVALGGRAGETCRLIVMSGPHGEAPGPALHAALQGADMGWRDVPVTRQSPIATKLSLLKRDPEGRPFLANILTPTQPGPVAMVVTVAAIPPHVTLPEGY